MCNRAWLSGLFAALVMGVAFAQAPHDHHTVPSTPALAEDGPAEVGPHGGSLKRVGSLQLETVVEQGGLRMYAFDAQGAPVAVDQARGAAVLRVEGKAKRYRYDLLPDGKGALLAPVNLSKVAGRQLEIDVQLVGMNASGLRLHEVAVVPLSESQLAADAIARQRICPVSGKPLGSMGQPVNVEVGDQQVFVCCAGCVAKVKENPEKFAAGRPEITVAQATAEDREAIAKQKLCPVMDEPLGSMGGPIKLLIDGKPIFLCCKGCIKRVKAEPAKYLAKVHGSVASVPAGTEEVRAGIFKVADVDAPFIAAQKQCPVMDEPLDAMGGPYKVSANGKAIYICCPGCAKRIAADPDKYLEVLARQGVNVPLLR